MSVSEILRESGNSAIVTASGFGWLVCFTLYPGAPAPARSADSPRARGLGQLGAVRARPTSCRGGPPLAVGSLATALVLVAGLVALVAFPGLLAPMRLQVDALDDLPAARDTRAFADEVLGLTSVALLVTTPPGAVLEPRTLAALDALSDDFENRRWARSVVGLPAVLGCGAAPGGAGRFAPPQNAQ